MNTEDFLEKFATESTASSDTVTTFHNSLKKKIKTKANFTIDEPTKSKTWIIVLSISIAVIILLAIFLYFIIKN